MISILTATIGREFYLKKVLESIERNRDGFEDFEQHIIFMREKPSNDMLEFINKLTFSSKIKLDYWDKVELDGQVMNICKERLNGELFHKMDDDCILRSPNYFNNVIEINKLVPNSMFSAFPCGLVNNLGGVPSKEHSVVYSEKLDTYYTLRKVHHIGGFGKIIPTEHIKKVQFTNARQEDTDTSNYCRANNIPMYYLENALIIEHAESSLSQGIRYREYFKNRESIYQYGK